LIFSISAYQLGQINIGNHNRLLWVNHW